METTEKQINEAEGFAIIQKMISTVKAEMEDDSFYNLLWGWLVFIASLGHYFLMLANYQYPFIMWFLMPVGAVITLVYGRKQERQKKVRTYLDDLMKYALTAFLVSLMIVLCFQAKLQMNTYPMVMMVYGIWLFISGGTIKFKPLMYGGIVNWILAIVSFFAPFEQQLLLLALAVLLGFIVPSYMFRRKYAKNV
jgi:hypothetical protein